MLERTQAISAAELERMMKLQDVILRAMAKKITWLEAAEIIGVCDRTIRRMRERYQEFGYNGLFDQRRRKAELQSSTPAAPGRMRWAVHIHSARGASSMLLRFPRQKDSIRLVSLNGRAALGSVDRDLRAIILKAVPAQGDDIVIDCPAHIRPEFQILDWTAGLPKALGPELTSPPADLISGAQFDLYNWSTVVSNNFAAYSSGRR